MFMLQYWKTSVYLCRRHCGQPLTTVLYYDVQYLLCSSLLHPDPRQCGLLPFNNQEVKQLAHLTGESGLYQLMSVLCLWVMLRLQSSTQQAAYNSAENASSQSFSKLIFTWITFRFQSDWKKTQKLGIGNGQSANSSMDIGDWITCLLFHEFVSMCFGAAEIKPNQISSWQKMTESMESWASNYFLPVDVVKVKHHLQDVSQSCKLTSSTAGIPFIRRQVEIFPKSSINRSHSLQHQFSSPTYDLDIVVADYFNRNLTHLPVAQ